MNKYQIRKAAARDSAIAWQEEFNDKCLSWSDLSYWNSYFTRLAKRYGLTNEFRENGII